MGAREGGGVSQNHYSDIRTDSDNKYTNILVNGALRVKV